MLSFLFQNKKNYLSKMKKYNFKENVMFMRNGDTVYLVSSDGKILNEHSTNLTSNNYQGAYYRKISEDFYISFVIVVSCMDVINIFSVEHGSIFKEGKEISECIRNKYICEVVPEDISKNNIKDISIIDVMSTSTESELLATIYVRGCGIEGGEKDAYVLVKFILDKNLKLENIERIQIICDDVDVINSCITNGSTYDLKTYFRYNSHSNILYTLDKNYIFAISLKEKKLLYKVLISNTLRKTDFRFINGGENGRLAVKAVQRDSGDLKQIFVLDSLGNIYSSKVTGSSSVEVLSIKNSLVYYLINDLFSESVIVDYKKRNCQLGVINLKYYDGERINEDYLLETSYDESTNEFSTAPLNFQVSIINTVTRKETTKILSHSDTTERRRSRILKLTNTLGFLKKSGLGIVDLQKQLDIPDNEEGCSYDTFYFTYVIDRDLNQIFCCNEESEIVLIDEDYSDIAFICVNKYNQSVLHCYNNKGEELYKVDFTKVEGIEPENNKYIFDISGFHKVFKDDIIFLHLTNDNLTVKHAYHSIIFYDLKNNKILYNNQGGSCWW